MKKTPRPQKAYQNAAFLNSLEARTVRILCEYLEPQSRFQKLGIQRSVIFFGSARLKPSSPHCKAAKELAEKLARWTVNQHKPGHRYAVVTGGGPGIMQAAHQGAARVDKKLPVGLNISLPFEQHVNPFVSAAQAFEFHYFFMRKFWFANLASALVVFPGGFGTLDELFEMLTLVQTGKAAPMPIVLYDRKFWNELINFKALVRQGLISPEDLDRFQYADSPDEALRVLTGALK